MRYSPAPKEALITIRTNDVRAALGKSLDSFAPIGPYLVTADHVPDPKLMNRIERLGELAFTLG